MTNYIILKINMILEKYMVCFDPLDGSSNIDSNITVGTIFAIYDLSESDNNTPLSDILKNGNSIVCAGYCLYGSSHNLY